MMTLGEAIRYAEEKACGNTECAEEYRQLAEWLKELKELKEDWQTFNNELERQYKLFGDVFFRVKNGKASIVDIRDCTIFWEKPIGPL